MAADQGVFQKVGPRPGRLDQTRLNGSGSVVLYPSGSGLDDQMETRQGRVVELDIISGYFAAEGVFQNGLHALTQIGVVKVARDEDEARQEALKFIAANEQRHPLTFLQIEDAEARQVKLLVRNLEQFVAWERLQNVEQGLAVVARRWEVGAVEGFLQLTPEQRYLTRAAVIGGGCKEPDE